MSNPTDTSPATKITAATISTKFLTKTLAVKDGHSYVLYTYKGEPRYCVGVFERSNSSKGRELSLVWSHRSNKPMSKRTADLFAPV